MPEIDPFQRMDMSDDAIFYSVERKVTHIDPGAISALRARYGELLPAGEPVLDLMSSWRSHLPESGLGPVTGLGMNGPEMADNPQLDSFVVHDLNANPVLPFEDGAFAAAVCSVSVQYLTRPVEVCTDLRRVVRPGGICAFAFSNRCFPTKAVAIWMAGSDADHVQLVGAYLQRSGWSHVGAESLPSTDDPVYVVHGVA